MMKYFIALPDTDHDGLQNAEEEYGWTVKRDINGDGDTDDTITRYVDGKRLVLHETMLPAGEVRKTNGVWSFWTAPDSDFDGLNDREEKEHHTHPQVSDTDRDLLSDWNEVNVYGTNASRSDTDGDGMTDLYEVRCGVDVGGWQDPNVYNERYAILIVGGIDSAHNYPRYWNSLVAIYDTLVDRYRYLPKNICAFYANGHHPTNTGDHKNTDSDLSYFNQIDKPFYHLYSAKKSNLKSVFASIGVAMDNNDFLFIWTFDHGGEDGDHATLCLWGEDIRDDTFAGSDYLGKIQHYSRIGVVMGECHSGGFIDNLGGNDLNDVSNIVVATACTKTESSWGSYFVDEWCRAITPTSGDVMKGNTVYNVGRLGSPDLDGNGYVSLYEAFYYAKTNDYAYYHGVEENNQWYFEHPQYYDSPDSIGQTTYL